MQSFVFNSSGLTKFFIQFWELETFLYVVPTFIDLQFHDQVRPVCNMTD